MTRAAQLETSAEPLPELARRRRAPLILIAGGGIAGLAAALALARRGIASHVLERRAAFAEDGAGIQIGPNGTRILAELGVADRLRPLAARPQSVKVMDGVAGRELARLPLGPWIEQRHGAPYWTLHRADLHGALLSAVRQQPLVRLSMAAEAQHLDSNTDGVTLLTAKGGSFGGDAVIAADGLWSSLRGAAFPRRPPPAYTGRAALRAVIPAEALPEALESTATHLWLATGAHAVHYPVRGGAEIAMVLIIEDPEAIEGWGREVSGEAMRTIAGRLPAPLAALTTLSNDWRKWSLYAMRGSGLRPWVSGRLALMGDAAHPVLPFLAQGGVLALEDAAVLARSISEGSGDIPAALADYERARRWRAARVARASARNGRIYHLSGLAARARDAVLTGTSGERLMRGWDWLYGWRA